jgi:hypothetical protein
LHAEAQTERSSDKDLPRSVGACRSVLKGTERGNQIVDVFQRSPVRVMFPRVVGRAVEEAVRRERSSDAGRVVRRRRRSLRFVLAQLPRQLQPPLIVEDGVIVGLRFTELGRGSRFDGRYRD